MDDDSRVLPARAGRAMPGAVTRRPLENGTTGGRTAAAAGRGQAATDAEGSAAARSPAGSEDRRSHPLERLLLPAAIVALVVVVVGGHVYRWTWTGFDRNGQLWDVLHVVVLPVVLATLPLWYHTRERWRVQWRVVFALTALAFACVVVGGYAGGWEWTGFQGNTLWDWLELLALPLVVAALPLWFETHIRRVAEWRWLYASLLVALAVVVVGGYRLGWTWTGFQGNTLYDWLRLLMVPFVLPAVLAWLSARRHLSTQ